MSRPSLVIRQADESEWRDELYVLAAVQGLAWARSGADAWNLIKDHVRFWPGNGDEKLALAVTCAKAAGIDQTEFFRRLEEESIPKQPEAPRW